MSKSEDQEILSIVNPVCCGLDVHKAKISACLITFDGEGKQKYEIREYPTFTRELLKLREWLDENSCPIVAMESTGVYWRPLHNILEWHMEVILVNARHVKNLPGRKTDISDSKWLASLLRMGLLKGSYIPGKEIRQCRELVILRKKYTESMGDYKRRVHKVFETANIKIDTVVSDLFGVTGRNLISILCTKEKVTRIEVEECVRGSLKDKVAELYQSIQGFYEAHHRFEIVLLMKTIDHLEATIMKISRQLDNMTKCHKELLDLLDEVPGINKIGAQSVISFVGTTMDEFKSDSHLVSWGGLCPGNNESAGKRKSGRSPVVKNAFKTHMIELSWAAVKKKGSYYKDKYYRLKARRGAKKAIVAIANRMTRAIYHIIKYGVSYVELGENYLSERNKKSGLNYLQKQAKLHGLQLIPRR
ncbi:MAG: IS110 family transposase [Planctomycetes bacterium]|nr:IS110 family transposase [Planctomycetota bacterium]